MNTRKADSGFNLFLICEVLTAVVSERMGFPDNHFKSYANRNWDVVVQTLTKALVAQQPSRVSHCLKHIHSINKCLLNIYFVLHTGDTHRNRTWLLPSNIWQPSEGNWRVNKKLHYKTLSRRHNPISLSFLRIGNLGWILECMQEFSRHTSE